MKKIFLIVGFVLLLGIANESFADDLVFTAVTPCRIIDTRQGGGPIPGGSKRDFLVIGTTGFTFQGGNSAGCGIPEDATSVMVIFIAVEPVTSGHLRAWPYGGTMPNASIVNFGAGQNIANGLIQPICNPALTNCIFDLSIYAASPVQVVADVTGYFTRIGGRVAIVAPSGGNYTDPVTAMANLNSWCPSPSATKPCLMKIMPGVYDIGSETINMQPYVSIEGSGELVTQIEGSKTSTDYCDAAAAVVHGARDTELRFLTFRNYGATGLYAVGIMNNTQGAPKMTNVGVSSQSPNAAFNFGIVNCPGSPEMLNVNVFAGDGSLINRGIYNSLGSSPDLTNGNVRSRGGIYSDGIRNEDSGISLRNSYVWGEYASTGSYGLSNDATGGSPPWITVVNSSVLGGTRGILNANAACGMSVAHSEIGGGVDNSGYIKCVGAYNHSLDPLNNTCQ